MASTDAIPASGIKPADPQVTPRRIATLVLFALATVLLVPTKLWVPGLACLAGFVVLAVRGPDPVFRRNFLILAACILLLAVTPINTDLSNEHFIVLGSIFALLAFGPYVLMRFIAPGEMVWRFWPRQLQRMDLIYTLLSIPLSWAIIQVYFFHLNPELPTHWPMPAEFDIDAVRRLTIGINLVGIFDELFFINTVYLLLRPLFPARIANLGQAVVYTSVLYAMAFTGAGIYIVYFFALTQGAMYEKSRVLLYVLVVHLIVDLFLVLAVLQYYYPDSARIIL